MAILTGPIRDLARSVNPDCDTDYVVRMCLAQQAASKRDRWGHFDASRVFWLAISAARAK